MDRFRPVFVLSTFLAVCAAAGATDEPPKKGTAKSSTTSSAGATKAGDEVAAVVNGERIMLAELIARLNELDVPPDKREDAANDVLDGLIDNALIVQYLAAQKVPYDATAVNAEFAELRAEAEKEGEKLGEALARVGMSEQKLRDTLIAQARWQNYLKQRVKDRELADFAAKNRDAFDSSQVRASHILVEIPAGADTAARAGAKAKMERIRKELAGGLAFPEAARKYSDCPSKDEGGDVGWFPRRGKMVEPFAKAAFALKNGETSGIVETEFGYHLIKVTERKPGQPIKLDDPETRQQVLEEYGDQLKETIVAQQRKTAKIEIAPNTPLPDKSKPKTATSETPGRTKK